VIHNPVGQGEPGIPRRHGIHAGQQKGREAAERFIPAKGTNPGRGADDRIDLSADVDVYGILLSRLDYLLSHPQSPVFIVP